jgi:hypothetical protein
MLRAIVRHLLGDFLILVVLLAASLALPILAFPLCRTPEGGMLLFWCGPWTTAVWSLLIVQLGGARFWRGAAQVRAWREGHGGYLHTFLRGTGWMFGGLLLSYLAEFAYIFTVPGTPEFRSLLPLVTYSPLIPAVWRAYRG